MATGVVEKTPTPIDLSVLEGEGKKIVKKYALLATGGGLIPIMGLDTAVVTAVQTLMVKKLAELYGVAYEPHQLRVVISSILSSAVGRVASIGMRQAFNSFGQFEKVADEMTNAALAGFVTATSGEVYRTHFARGGQIHELDITDFWEYIDQKISDGEIGLKTFTSPSSGFSHLF